MNKYHKIIMCLLLIGITSILFGVTYSFFNYTKTGTENTVSVGRINFTTTENDNINLINAFPITKKDLQTDVGNHDEVTIAITGDTNYSGGIEYVVSIVDVSNEINGKHIPLSYTIQATNIGERDLYYWGNRGGDTAIYNYNEAGIIEENNSILAGYIPANDNGINGSINITTYIDANRIAITDTHPEEEITQLVNGEPEVVYTNGTTGNWVLGREVFTQEEWNNFNANDLSFKVKIEAREGVWVPLPEYRIMANLYAGENENWVAIMDSISSIEFNTDGEVPNNAITSFDATDVTSSGPVTVYTLDDGKGNNTVKVVVTSDKVIYGPDDMQFMFSNLPQLTTFNSKNFRVDGAVNMYCLFADDTILSDIYSISQWNTSYVYDMEYMFVNCSGITNLDMLKYWDTGNLVYLDGIFGFCTSLVNVDGLKNWDVRNVQSTVSMFHSCFSLEEVDLSGWEANSLLNISDMFGMWNSDNSVTTSSTLKRIYLSDKFDTSHVTDMNMFVANNTGIVDYSFLQYIDTGSVDGSGSGFQAMFQNNNGLTDLSYLSSWDVSKAKNMSYMFSLCMNLSNLTPISGWNVSNVVNLSYAFAYTKITNVDALSGWNVSNAVNLSSVFAYTKVTNVDALSNWNIGKATNISYMFFASKLTNLNGLANWDIRNVTTMECIFQRNTPLTNISALSNWATKLDKATDINSLVQDCSNLTDISALSSWNVSKITNMSFMFAGCTSLTNYSPISGWDVGKVSNMYRMFNKTGITNLNALANWNVSSVTNMQNMFGENSSLTDISALSNWATKVNKVTNFRTMFQSCPNLLDASALNDWNIKSTANFTNMFKGTPTHPTFSLVTGTWDSNGTFTPTT